MAKCIAAVLVLFTGVCAAQAPAATSAAQKAASASKTRRYINFPRPVKAPFSNGVLVGDTLYLSGNIGLTPDGKLPADIDEEIKNMLDGIENVLKAADMTMDDLVSVQVFCSDVSLFSRFNQAYVKRFKGDFPARSFLGSGTLLFNAHFEMNAVAVKR